ncbi:MAG TPA: PEP-CTERM sorting domain-containing protein [Bryobacteraceae bacterium]|nr:PEP-CTERM sorting domain-containing protein [Bryobacteraceae bacterium]
MLRYCLLIAVVCLFAFPGVGLAIGIDVIGGDPCQLVTLSQVQASGNVDANGNACFDLANQANGIITSLMFQVTINPGLDPNGNLIKDAPFTCGQGGAGYFLNCNITYNSSNGVLDFMFSGVNRADRDEGCPSPDCEINEQEGIPPGGLFHIDLTGWIATATVNDPQQIFPNNQLPEFTNTETIPEPSTVYSSIIGFLLLAGIVELRRRKRAA